MNTVDTQSPIAGVHVAEWGAEAAGTALLMIGGLSAVCLDFGRGSPVASAIPSIPFRLLITGLLFGGTGSLVAISPLGRLSGAHLNPAVTLAFRITGHVHPHDLAGYVVAQCTGAVIGAGLVRMLWGNVALSVGDGATRPQPGVGLLAAVAIEALMTAVLIATIIIFLSRRRLMPWTPLVVWLLVALLVWRGAPYTGTSLNPARSLGPAVIIGNLSNYWVYVAGPLLGAGATAMAGRWAAGLRPMTAKLYPDARYTSTMASDIPVAAR